VAVAQRRWGLEAVRTLAEEFIPLVEIEPVRGDALRSAVDSLLTAGRRRLSLVDCISFARMRALHILDYLGADHHFDEQGFRRYARSD
jgi:predicted nucleic acid-binding protein